MMKLSKKVDYGLIVLAALHRMPEAMSAREMAGRFSLPQPMVANILKSLTSAGITHSTRGAQGGYGLTRPASEISLADVVKALDGPIHLMDCTADEHSCKLVSCCPTHSPVQALQQRFMQFMQAVSLADLAEQPNPSDIFKVSSDENAYLSR